MRRLIVCWWCLVCVWYDSRAAAAALALLSPTSNEGPRREGGGVDLGLEGDGSEATVDATGEGQDVNLAEQLPQGFDPAGLVPVVLLHGIGASSSNPHVGHNGTVANLIRKAFPGIYVTAPVVSDGMLSITTPIDQQVDSLHEAVAADPRLAQGFNAVGISQGGLIMRAYVEEYNSPPVLNLVSIFSPQEGISECTALVSPQICDLVREKMFDAPVSFAGYWKVPFDKKSYLSRSMLSVWNNERPSKNPLYRANMIRLRSYMLLHATRDEVITPSISSEHGIRSWIDPSRVLPLEETDGYKHDWIGLRTLLESGRLIRVRVDAQHGAWQELERISEFEDQVLPVLGRPFGSPHPGPAMFPTPRGR